MMYAVCLLNRRQENKRLCTEWWSAVPYFNVLIIFSCTQLWFLSLILIYMNFAVLNSGDVAGTYALFPLCLLLDQPPYLGVKVSVFVFKLCMFCLIKHRDRPEADVSISLRIYPDNPVVFLTVNRHCTVVSSPQVRRHKCHHLISPQHCHRCLWVKLMPLQLVWILWPHLTAVTPTRPLVQFGLK